MLPLSAVLKLSPAKIVVPTAAPVPPTLARSDATIMPSALSVAPQTGVISKQDAKNAATISRERAIEASKRATRRILTLLTRVNTESLLEVKIYIVSGERPPLAVESFHCYNASQHMADWKQITARIRRARTGKDPVGQLSNLYEKTRDAMVAFELARYFETAGQNPEAAKWYLAAADRFRRADWKTKAHEAAARLGGEIPPAGPSESASEFQLPPPPIAAAEPSSSEAENAAESEFSSDPSESEVKSVTAMPAGESAEAESPDKKRRRRGRRGGRNRRKGAPLKGSAIPSTSASSTAASPVRGLPSRVFDEPAEPVPPRTADSRSIPSLPVEPFSEPGGPSVRGRSGDPGLSSRLSLLEMQLRRLLTCPPVKLNEADHAPVGPGVFVLTDSDLTSYYYVEACQTLRIAVGNLLRGGSSRHTADSIKPRLAEHLGIPESRVTKYLADHCVVRWLQLDDGASHFAHFVIAVIRPTLND